MCSHARKKLQHRQQQQQTNLDGFLPQQDWHTATNADFKEHFTMAYNQVASEVAGHTKEQADKCAQILMQRLGYTSAELNVIGDDAWVMQGTGNPHVLANIQNGDVVVDLGSGFGMDAFIAASKVGDSGRVVGVDLSIGEVTSAIKRARSRRIVNCDFRVGDIEDAPLADNSTDVAISNGGFCLVPDKPKAFSEIFRILKPGGRFSISCTTRKKALEADKSWPSCMVVFMPLASVESMLSAIGFTDIVVDTSNSRMDIWDEVKNEASHTVSADTMKITVHRGDPRFDFLKELNMNDYCARVNIFAKKPLSVGSKRPRTE